MLLPALRRVTRSPSEVVINTLPGGIGWEDGLTYLRAERFITYKHVPEHAWDGAVNKDVCGAGAGAQRLLLRILRFSTVPSF